MKSCTGMRTFLDPPFLLDPPLPLVPSCWRTPVAFEPPHPIVQRLVVSPLYAAGSGGFRRFLRKARSLGRSWRAWPGLSSSGCQLCGHATCCLERAFAKREGRGCGCRMGGGGRPMGKIRALLPIVLFCSSTSPSSSSLQVLTCRLVYATVMGIGW